MKGLTANVPEERKEKRASVETEAAVLDARPH